MTDWDEASEIDMEGLKANTGSEVELEEMK
jgi:hypothetical protein